MAFREDMQNLILRGRKTATTRKRKKGSVGDIFMLDGRMFRIVAIKKRTLEYIASEYFDLEGCKDAAQFREVWTDLHEGKYEDRMHYVHFFAPVIEPTPEIQRLTAVV